MGISDNDAKKDGIRVTTEGGEFRKYKAYHIICSNCGCEYVKRQYNSYKEHLCDRCRLSRNRLIKTKKQAQEMENLLKYKTPKEIKFDKAIEEMKKRVSWDARYERCAKIAAKRVEAYGSIPEMIVAIELLYCGYSITPQQAIGRYKVDFLIPRQRIVIEVDGGVYHTKQKEDREAVIQLSLGMEWRILHIPAEYIRKHIKELDTMIQIATRGKK